MLCMRSILINMYQIILYRTKKKLCIVGKHAVYSIQKKINTFVDFHWYLIIIISNVFKNLLLCFIKCSLSMTLEYRKSLLATFYLKYEKKLFCHVFFKFLIIDDGDFNFFILNYDPVKSDTLKYKNCSN